MVKYEHGEYAKTLNEFISALIIAESDQNKFVSAPMTMEGDRAANSTGGSSFGQRLMPECHCSDCVMGRPCKEGKL